ncbi:hypothetical protein [Arachnia propionica]|uniref:hypothetical protein n=1 Tax=Arachnia propionica TaxID=1750 RepID=UPI00163B53A8|nr:hypothetical protein [Arachnia propionica]
MSNNQWNGAQDWNAQPQQNNAQEWGAQPTQDWNAQPQQNNAQEWGAQPTQQQDWGQPSQDWNAQQSPQPTSDDWTTVATPQNEQPAASPQSASGEWNVEQPVPATEQTTWTGAVQSSAPEHSSQNTWGQQQDWNTQPAQQPQQDWNAQPAQQPQQDWSQQQPPQQQWGQQAAYGAPQQQWGQQPMAVPGQPNFFAALFDFKLNNRVVPSGASTAFLIVFIALAARLVFGLVAAFSEYNSGLTIAGVFVALAEFVALTIAARVLIEGVATLVKRSESDKE